MLDYKSRVLLEKYGEITERTLSHSDIFMTIFTESYKQDPLCCFQLGMAIMMNKRIALVVENGTTIPNQLNKAADAIEHYDSSEKDSIKAAADRLLKALDNQELR